MFSCDVCDIIVFVSSEKVKPETYLPIMKLPVNGSMAIEVGTRDWLNCVALMYIPLFSEFVLVHKSIWTKKFTKLQKKK